jgi:hypothetical protein
MAETRSPEEASGEAPRECDEANRTQGPRSQAAALGRRPPGEVEAPANHPDTPQPAHEKYSPLNESLVARAVNKRPKPSTAQTRMVPGGFLRQQTFSRGELAGCPQPSLRLTHPRLAKKRRALVRAAKPPTFGPLMFGVYEGVCPSLLISAEAAAFSYST